MRISSNTMFDSNVAAMNQQQSKLYQTQQQVSSGRRILTAADDPAAAARALDVSASDAMNTQYTSNRNAVSNTLSLAENALQSVTSLIQDVQTAVVSAGNGSLTTNDRKTFAANLSARLQDLASLANSTDGTGNYLFAGFQSQTKPFVDTPAGMGYFGDDGQRNVQVSDSREMSSSNSGADAFMRIKNGNGTFVSQAASANTGTGIVSMGSVSDPGLLTGDSYTVEFDTLVTQAAGGNSGTGRISTASVVTPGSVTGDNYTVTFNPIATQAAGGNTGTIATPATVLTPSLATAHDYRITLGAGGYSVMDLTTNTAVAPAGVTVTGVAPAAQTVAFDGIQVSINGAVTNDVFNVSAPTYDVTDTSIPTTVSLGTPYINGQAIAFDGIQFNIQGAPVPGDVFNVSPPVTGTYTVTNNTTGLPVTGLMSQTYVSGQSISFDGMQIDIQGTPASGDKFTVSPSTNESVFKTISDLITALNASGAGASLTNSLNLGLNNLGNALNNTLAIRSSLGLRLNEIDSLQTVGDDLGLQLKKTLSQLQDVDSVKAISDLTQQQQQLQAAQLSFAKVANLSLFSYL